MLAALGACDEDAPPEPNEPERTQFVAVYFEEAGRLVPEYHPLGDGEPERALWDLLLTGPSDPELSNALDGGPELLQAAEPDEGRLLLEIDETFWDQDAQTIYRAAAQIVFTMGNLEEGGAVTLVDGLRPGRIRGPDGRRVEQPLERADFERPLVQVQQPVAGSVVGETIPIRLSLAHARPVAVSLQVEGQTEASTIVHGGVGELVVSDAPGGWGQVQIELPEVTVEVPVRLPARS